MDQRMVFLTVELSTTETTIAAVNKALKVNGYRKAVLEEAAENARKEHAKMDRQGGGPVSWQEFYGKTAQSFFYHPEGNEVAVSIGAPTVPRPPQFDYIYRANDEYREKAEQDAASIGSKIDDLLEHRSALEAQQSALWFKIAARGVSTLEIEARPLYRFELAPGPGGTQQQADSIRAGGDFLRAVSAAADHVQKSIDNDQKGCIEELEQTTTTVRTQLQSKLHALAVADDLQNPKTAIGAFSLCAKRLQDSAQNMADAQKLAIESDSRGDPVAKQNYRGQLQQMIFDYATTLASADQILSRAAREWKVVCNTGKPLDGVASTKKPDNSAIEKTPAQLDAAKAQYQQDISNVRRALVAAIESRLNAAADAGDLETVETLQAAKAHAARDGSIPDNVKDPAILKAEDQMAQSEKEAGMKLAGAYKQAIRDYTRARDISEAQAVRDEFNASGLNQQTAEAGLSEPPGKSSARPHGAGSGGAIVKLTARLPAYLMCRGSLNVAKDGVLLPDGTYVVTKDTNFLKRDFVLDLWMTVDPKKPSAFIGLGPGQDGNGGGPGQSLFLLVSPNGGLQVVADTFAAEHIGQETEAGDYVVRIEKSGTSVTFSIGVEKDGEFAPDFSRAFPDITQTCPNFSDHNIHLFFRGGFYKQIRLATETSGSNESLAEAGAMNSTDKVSSRLHGAGASGAIVKLTARLPAYLVCRGSLNVEKDGISLPEHTYVVSKEANFFKRDFVLDLWMTVDPKKPSSFIGLGTGQDGEGANPDQSLSLLVNHFSNGGLQMVGYTFNAEDIGQEKEAGDYIVRIEKSGKAVTFSIGIEKGGEFASDFSRAFPDITQICPNFNDHNVHLFFRGGFYKKIRLTTAATGPGRVGSSG